MLTLCDLCCARESQGFHTRIRKQWHQRIHAGHISTTTNVRTRWILQIGGAPSLTSFYDYANSRRSLCTEKSYSINTPGQVFSHVSNIMIREIMNYIFYNQ